MHATADREAWTGEPEGDRALSGDGVGRCIREATWLGGLRAALADARGKKSIRLDRGERTAHDHARAR
jgi:hypothetical protein